MLNLFKRNTRLGRRFLLNITQATVLYNTVFAATVATAASKPIKTFVCRHGGYAVVTSEVPKLAAHDIILINPNQHLKPNGSKWMALRAANPNIKIYTYSAPEYSNPSADNPNVIAPNYCNTLGRYNNARGHSMGNTWTDHPEFFLKSKDGRYIFYNKYLNDYHLDVSSTGVRAYVTEALLTDYGPGHDWHADGVYLDNITPSRGNICATYDETTKTWTVEAPYMNGVGQPVNLYTQTGWVEAMNGFTNYIVEHLGTSLLVGINRGGAHSDIAKNAWKALDESTFPPDFQWAEAAWMHAWSDEDVQYFDINQWRYSLDTMTSIKNSKTLWQAHTAIEDMNDVGITTNDGSNPTAVDVLHYALASYMIGMSDNTYFGMLFGYGDKSRTSYNVARDYEPEFDMAIGAPKGNYDFFESGSATIYRREFDFGYVYVNPTFYDSQTIDLPEDCKRLTRGNFDESKWNGVPTTKSLALAKHRGAFFIKKTVFPTPPDGLRTR